jgi:hypothetical protein
MTSPTTFANFGPARSTHPRDLFLPRREAGDFPFLGFCWRRTWGGGLRWLSGEYRCISFFAACR